MLSEDEQKRQLYNRQEYVVGAETQAKYGSTTVLVVGATGLAAEIIKNIVLTGVKSVKVLDDALISIEDLGTNFFLHPGDVGKPRGATVASAAKELNRFVDVSAVTGDALAHIPTVHVVIYANDFTARLGEANRVARTHHVKFLSCESRGVCGCVFVDGGAALDIVDTDGEDTVTCVVTALSPEGLVTLQEDKNHECEVGSKVYFTGLSAVPGANTADPSAPAAWRLFEVAEVISPHIMRLAGIKELMGSGEGGGAAAIDVGTSAYLHTTKKGRREHYKTVEESLANPECLMIFDKEEKHAAAATLHAMFTAVAKRGHAPTSAADVEEVIRDACAANAEAEADVMRLLLPVFAGDLNPMACFIGGMAAQEALKVCSGKFTPLHQWLYYDAREVLQARLCGAKSVSAGATAAAAAAGTSVFPDRTATPSRYSSQEAVLGHAFQSYLHGRKAFIVGAGALGCELIKNVALMGIGEASITDMDTIEMSNLSRQFLFRHHHIGRAKSVVAAEAARKINEEVKMTSYESKMAPETEVIFNEDFWARQSVVLNALDNVMSRKYVDERCLFYQKPLFESGTLGTKCNMQPVIPFVTESYSSSYDPPERGIPLCTLKNFPNAIEHTIQWARDLFHLLFASVPADVNQYLNDPAGFAHNLKNDPAAADTVLKNVNDALVRWPTSAADCVRLARLLYQEHFNDGFRQLLHNIPLDKRNEDGQLFWSGAKKPPTPQEFDPSCEDDIEFVYHCTCLFAEIYQLSPFALSKEETAQMAAAVQVPEFVPRHAVFATSEKQTSQQTSSPSGISFADLPPASHFGARRMKAEEFDKDDSTNHHMQFITYCSNMRARAYHIPAADLNQTKRIAGNIIPAMVTTTSLVTGLVGFEVLKYLLIQFHHHQQHSPASSTASLVYLDADEEPEQLVTLFRSAFVNIALPFIAFSDPIVAQQRCYVLPSGKKLRWGIWDRLEVAEGRDLPVKELVQLLHDRYELEVFMIALTNGKMIYTEFGGKAKDKEKRVSVVAQEKGEILQEEVAYFDLVVTGMIGNDDDVDVPIIRYRYRF
ncbi:putative ubiquitin-activating enzyme e1 [Leptomonas pyrrhocoris]|uniref:Putative ubiquitin-activating enzyme e1 n=1 Tax=Leptomonas pyrrhocoris TaxID=157538 RepID=A0A0N0DYI0_LEPPY|nr:putative ubiquitin-activating enzyme e1 [Leptomonas pyrrhocoris]XP_015662461.1 putative ubiquitin-activating enzyme e1 [Leptomonas pyrrhocoris]KPA84021.1 putative ubiquitin-activating enzyme e1 [Leptomonas pyrrhocoris]KPA84022.1 putative ubiquitin-activating enzyme e1 [Leptomonas pyrrhocoris]|eukprot:XP_015662460.1 putative ubiquitin-activating enzyme e1 [Leptomonas pyrrhocoris]